MPLPYHYSPLERKMAAKSARFTLVEIGSRGTVGSLVLREIEYFSRLELGRRGEGPHNNPCCHFADVASTSGISKPKLGSLAANPKKKKRGCKKFLPSMCSMVEVIESNNRPRAISGFTYKNLKADIKELRA